MTLPVKAVTESAVKTVLQSKIGLNHICETKKVFEALSCFVFVNTKFAKLAHKHLTL